MPLFCWFNDSFLHSSPLLPFVWINYSSRKLFNWQKHLLRCRGLQVKEHIQWGSFSIEKKLPYLLYWQDHFLFFGSGFWGMYNWSNRHCCSIFLFFVRKRRLTHERKPVWRHKFSSLFHCKLLVVLPIKSLMHHLGISLQSAVRGKISARLTFSWD